MTSANTTDEVMCADGITRPADSCVQVSDGGWFLIDDCVTIDDTWYHSDDNRICYVDSIDDWMLREDCVLVNGQWERDEDVGSCDSCGRSCLLENLHSTPADSYYCERCHGETVSCCSNCGDEHWSDDGEIDEDGYCSACARPRLIANYSDKTANRLRSETKDKLRFGVELEVEGYETATDAANYIRKFLPDTYCVLKRDGSLGEAGVEIVTRPDSMAVHKRMFGTLFSDSPGRALSSWNTNRCGMHVHISRAALSQLQIGKMLCFLNEPVAVPFISKVAGRRPCHWCKVHKKKLSDVRHDHDRYTALNVTGPHTVEIRIFKGTLAESGFLKNLEFVEALVEFTAPANRSIAQATSYRAFCDWLPKKTYPHLHAFLVRQGFIRRRSVAA